MTFLPLNRSLLSPFSILPIRYPFGHIIILTSLPIICLMVPATLCLCLPLLCPWNSLCCVSFDDQVHCLGEGMGHPQITYVNFISGLMGSISDVLRHPSPYLQAGVKGCNWLIRGQGGNSRGPWITPYRTFLAPATHADALLAW